MHTWLEVSSSFIAAIAYDASTETVFVRFKDSAEWSYGPCPPHLWDEFASPNTSKGQFFHRVLKHLAGIRMMG